MTSPADDLNAQHEAYSVAMLAQLWTLQAERLALRANREMGGDQTSNVAEQRFAVEYVIESLANCAKALRELVALGFNPTKQ